MDYSVIGTALGIVLLVFVLFGFLLGLLRGWRRSVLRLGMVVATVVLTVLMTPVVSNALLTVDISSFGLEVSGIRVTTISDFVIALLGTFGLDSATIEAMPTFKSLILNLPLSIVNLVAYVLFLIVLSVVVWIIYLILAAILFPKRKRAVHKKLRLVGAAVGAVQGLIVFLAILMPTAGVMGMVNDCLTVFESQNETTQSAVVAYVEHNDNVYVVTGVGEEEDSFDDQIDGPIENEENGENNDVFDFNLDSVKSDARVILDAYYETPVIKVLNFIGYDKVSQASFDYLFSFKINNENVKIREELVTISKAIKDVDGIAFDKNLTSEQIAQIKACINDSFNSKIVSGIIGEVLPTATKKWANNEKFFVEKPTVDGSLQQILDAVYDSFAKSNAESVKKDLIAVVDCVDVASKYGVWSDLLNGSDDMIATMNKEGFVRDIISTLLSSETIKNVFPTALDVGMQEMYGMLGIDNAGNYKVTKKSSDLSAAQWRTEQEVIGTICEDMIKFVVSIKDVDEMSIDSIDMELLGKIFDNMRKSIFLGANSKNIVIGMMKSDMVGGAIPIEFVNKVETEWDTINFVSTFKVVKASLNITKKMGENENGLSEETIGMLLDSIQEEGTKELIAELATEENLKSMGIADETAGAVSEIISNLANSENSDFDAEKETAAMQTIMDTYDIISNNAGKDNADKQDIVTEDNAEQIVESLTNSSVLLDAITQTEGTGSISETIQNEVDADQQNLIADQIDAKKAELTENATGLSEAEVERQMANLDKIAGLFGIEIE